MNDTVAARKRQAWNEEVFLWTVWSFALCLGVVFAVGATYGLPHVVLAWVW